MSQTPTISSSEELCSLVSYALDTALSLGATAAAVEVSEEKGTCVTVRNQETESIEHTHDRDFGITVYLGKSKAVASSGDFRKVSILRTVKAALDMARYTTPDECNGLPDKDRLCTNPRQLDLFHPWDISIEEQVQKAVEAEKAVERDLLQVSLFYQAEGNDLSALNKTMAEKMNKAIELAKAQSAVEIKDNSRNTWIRYDNKGKQQGWIARAELTLESKDSQALSTLVNELDGVLDIAQVNASVSREKLSSLENEITKEAFANLKDKAVLIQESLKVTGYRLQTLEISPATD